MLILLSGDQRDAERVLASQIVIVIPGHERRS
jgi:hypothetical protein